MKNLFLAFALVGLLMGCTPNGGKGSPENVAKNFIESMERRDLASAKQYTTEKSQELLDRLLELGGDQTIESDYIFESTRKETVGDTVKVYYRVAQDEEQEEVVNLVKENGEWKVVFEK